MNRDSMQRIAAAVALGAWPATSFAGGADGAEVGLVFVVFGGLAILGVLAIPVLVCMVAVFGRRKSRTARGVLTGLLVLGILLLAGMMAMLGANDSPGSSDGLIVLGLLMLVQLGLLAAAWSADLPKTGERPSVAPGGGAGPQP